MSEGIPTDKAPSIDPVRQRQEKFKNKVIPNIPEEFVAIGSFTPELIQSISELDGADITREMLELGKLVKQLEGAFHREAGDATMGPGMSHEAVKMKVDRFKVLLAEKVKKQQELLAALQELYPDVK